MSSGKIVPSCFLRIREKKVIAVDAQSGKPIPSTGFTIDGEILKHPKKNVCYAYVDYQAAASNSSFRSTHPEFMIPPEENVRRKIKFENHVICLCKRVQRKSRNGCGVVIQPLTQHHGLVCWNDSFPNDVMNSKDNFISIRTPSTDGILHLNTELKELYYLPLKESQSWYRIRNPLVQLARQCSYDVCVEWDLVKIFCFDGERIVAYEFEIDVGRDDNGFENGTWWALRTIPESLSFKMQYETRRCDRQLAQTKPELKTLL